MSYTGFEVDCENTGDNPFKNSMYWLGAVRLDRRMTTTFEGKMRPKLLPLEPGETNQKPQTEFVPDAMVSGVTWDEIQNWGDPAVVMNEFADWLEANTFPGTTPEIRLVSDNAAHDYFWIKLYMYEFTNRGHLVGHTARNINDQFRGLKAGLKYAGIPIPDDMRSFKSLKDTPHTHEPVDDAMGNTEATIKLVDRFGLPIIVHD